MRRSGATFVLAVFLAGVIAADAALARSGGRGGYGRGHHASGSIAKFHRSPSAAAVVVTPRPFYGGYRAPFPYYYPPLAYYPPGMYAPGPYYAPGPAYLPYPPSEYIEQGQEAAAPQPEPAPQAEPAPAEPSAAYWWFCPGASNYYPYVKTCPSGWQRVKPQP
jgi:hypothetical protein